MNAAPPAVSARPESRLVEKAGAGREPPYNAEVEQALLGVILRSNAAFDQVGDYLMPEHFYVPEHQLVYRWIKLLIKDGKEASPPTLSHAMQSEPIFEEVGGTAYLYELASNIVTMINVADYGKTILDLHIKREIIGLCNDALLAAMDGSDIEQTGERILDQMSDYMLRLMDGNAAGETQAVSLADAIQQQIEVYQKAASNPDSIGLKTGLKDLDDLVIGLMDTDLTILAARPGIGKTALALAIATNIQGSLSEDEECLFITLEMSAQQLAGRKLSAATGVSAINGYRGDVTSRQFDQMILVQRQMQKCALRFVDRGGMTVSQIDSILRRENHRRKVRVLVIDYLQILTPSAASRGHQNRTNEVSEMTRELKQMAMRWKIPILLLSQLSRECEKREDKRPMLSDLRDSGSIEQDANNVWFLYRDEYYAGKEEPQQRTTESGEDFAQRYARWSDRLANARNKMEVIIAKHRTGPTGKIDLFCDLTTMRFGSLDKVHQQEDML